MALRKLNNYYESFQGGSVAKNPPANAGDMGLIPELGRSPRGGNGNPFQCSLPGESHGQRRLEGYNPWGPKESDMPKQLTLSPSLGVGHL